MLPLTTYLRTGSKSNGEALEIVLLRYFRFCRFSGSSGYFVLNSQKTDFQ